MTAPITSQDLWRRWGPRLRQAREVAGLTQTDLAEKSGVSQTVISAIERCISGGRDASRASLARALGRPAADLFPYDDDDQDVAS